jgi:hypothetical protein
MPSTGRATADAGYSVPVADARDEDRGSRRGGWPAGTSTRAICTPSGSSIHISINPQGSVWGSWSTRTPAADSYSCSARTSRTWIQTIDDRPGLLGQRPENSRNPEPRKNTTPGSAADPNSPVDRQAQHVAVETPALIKVGQPQRDSAAQASTPRSRQLAVAARRPTHHCRASGGNRPRPSGSRLRWRSALHSLMAAKSMTAPRWPAEKRRHDEHLSVQAPLGLPGHSRPLLRSPSANPGPGPAEPARSMSPRCPSARGPTARRAVCCRTRPADTPAGVAGWLPPVPECLRASVVMLSPFGSRLRPRAAIRGT